VTAGCIRNVQTSNEGEKRNRIDDVHNVEAAGASACVSDTYRDEDEAKARLTLHARVAIHLRSSDSPSLVQQSYTDSLISF